MTEYKIALIKREEVAAGTMAFYFEKPKGFEFQAGQHAVFTLLNPLETDDEGNRRVFCFASAPYEGHLMIAMRMRDTAFKRTLKTLPRETEIQMEGPYGSFVLREDLERPAVFLAGGIGVTPFRSMLFQVAHDNEARSMYFFYSNRCPEDSAFLGELKILEQRNVHYKFIPTMTVIKNSVQSWNGEIGYINKDMLTRYLPELVMPVYYIAGSPAMVFAMRGMLQGAGIGSESIEIDQFAGY